MPIWKDKNTLNLSISCRFLTRGSLTRSFSKCPTGWSDLGSPAADELGLDRHQRPCTRRRVHGVLASPGRRVVAKPQRVGALPPHLARYSLHWRSHRPHRHHASKLYLCYNVTFTSCKQLTSKEVKEMLDVVVLKSISVRCGTARSFGNPTAKYMIEAFVGAVLCSQPHKTANSTRFLCRTLVVDYFHGTCNHGSILSYYY
jgi:hypothetical protein